MDELVDGLAAIPAVVSLGARVQREDGDLVVMADPEGNEFCLET